MLLSESTAIEKISPNQARLWIDSCKYEGQRKLKQYWVDFLASQMEKGKFNAPSAPLQFCFCMENSESYLVNGQHTLNAIVKSGIPLDGAIVVRTIADTKSEVDRYYITIDIQNKRTTRDAFRALGVEVKWGIGQEAARSLSTAAVWIENRFFYKYHRSSKERGYLSDLDRYVLGEKWLEDYKRFDNAISPCESDVRQKLHYGGILSVAIMTFRYRPIDAIGFWKQVAQDDGLKLGDPRKTLHRWMMTHASTNVKGNNMEIAHPDVFPRATAKCWTKWMEGNELRTMRIDHDQRIEDSLFGITRDEITQHYDTIKEN